VKPIADSVKLELAGLFKHPLSSDLANWGTTPARLSVQELRHELVKIVVAHSSNPLVRHLKSIAKD